MGFTLRVIKLGDRKRAAMMDRLGDDWRGQLILAEFEREGVGTERIVIERVDCRSFFRHAGLLAVIWRILVRLNGKSCLPTMSLGEALT